MKPLKIIVGVILAMASLWLGCYFLGQYLVHWQGLPILVSMIVGIGVGVWAVIDGVV